MALPLINLSSWSLQFPCGSLYLFIGPMSSNKSTALIMNAGMIADLHLQKVLLIVHSSDKDRVDGIFRMDGISCHGSHFRGISSKVTVIFSDNLSSIDITDFTTIAIEEGQFFQDLEAMVRSWVVDFNKIVLISALSGDFELNVFGPTINLIPLATNIFKMSAQCALCMIFKGIYPCSADYSARLTREKKQVIVAGKNIYRPACLYCFKCVRTLINSDHPQMDQLLEQIRLDQVSEQSSLLIRSLTSPPNSQ